MANKFRVLKADEIEIRIGQECRDGFTFLLYKTARTDADILDETVGAMNWQKSYSRDNQNCTVSIWDAKKSQWISKEDTGTESNTEKEKGLASDSFKRACVMWGIGRELYTSPLIYVPFTSLEIREINGKKRIKGCLFVSSIETGEDKKIEKLEITYENKGESKVVFSWAGKNKKQPVGKKKKAGDPDDPANYVFKVGNCKGQSLADAVKTAAGIETVKFFAKHKKGENEDWNEGIKKCREFARKYPDVFRKETNE